jgi:YidC/Oxa1 family membrane protein insertase
LAEFNNPQQEPGMERKLLLVFALTFLVIMLFQPLLKKYGPQPPAKQASSQENSNANQAQVAPVNSAPAGAQDLQNAGAIHASGRTNAAAATQAIQQASTESETVIENDVYRIVFTNRGGRVKSWILKKYTDDKGGQLELVNSAASDKYGYPLSLFTYDEGLRNKLNSVLYVAPDRDARDAEAGRGEASGVPSPIQFAYDDGDVSVRKSFKFDRSSYVVEINTSVAQKGSPVTAFPMWPAGFGSDLTGPQYATGQIIYQYDDKVERLAIKKISGGGTVQGPFSWAGISDQYFAAVFLPKTPQSAAMVTLHNSIEIPHNSTDGNNKQLDKVDVLGAAVGDVKGPTDERIYVGPKALGDLEAVSVPGMTGAEPDLRAIIDFGWLGIIARPLFLWLKWMYNHIVGNWGWAILLQTLIINLALLPLRLSQMKSMLKMQRVAPQIKSIQEKYKKYSLRDPRKAEMNTEISELYKKEGVNPAGGCLPLVIQMPFLFAYYRMLNVAMDLRHAPWMWVHDLSAPDPWHILPVAIIVTMLIMQRMTPQAGMDPAQQKMMNVMMPGMLGIMSWNLPAGLGLYWSAGQLIGIVQQSVMNRTSLGREMREMMAKRARKKEK